jgi:LPXTG-site transpeptidase (sortase) family protein
MSVVATTSGTTPDVNPRPPLAATPARRRQQWRRRVVRISLIALLILVAAFALFDVFEGPVARSWYQTRQRQLASDLNGAHRHIVRGDAVGILQVPRLGVNAVVAQGDDPQQLRSGPGHRIGTPMPGAKGNVVIVGHRSGWGSPFGALGRVRKNDVVALTNKALPTTPTVYTVTSVKHVSGSDVQPFARSTDYRLTLITGDGGRLSTKRIVVTAVSGPTKSRPASLGTVHASTSAGSLVLNSALLLAFAGGVGLLLAFALLRPRTGTVAFVAVLTPFAVLTLLGVLLEVDLFFPPLR